MQEINALRLVIAESNDLKKLQESVYWKAMENILKVVVEETEKRGRLANPLSEQGAFEVIFNNGFISALNMVLNLPAQKTEQVTLGGLEAKLYKTMAEMQEHYPPQRQ
jgi:hypothetical protein